MECIFVFLMLVVTLGLLAGFGVCRAPGNARCLASYRELAERYHGTLVRTGWRGLPRVSFPYRAAIVTVEALARGPRKLGRGAAVRVRLPWLERAWQLEIRHPPRLATSAARGPGQPIRWTSDASQGRCAVWGTDAQAACQLLNEVVRWEIERLCTQPIVSPLSVQFGRGVLDVSKVLTVRRGPELIAIVEMVLDLYDQALLTQTRDITFLEQQSAQVLEQPVCRVCGEVIREGLVFCRRCKTPHHRECWLYVGRCSVFACGESQFREPQVAARLPGERGTRSSSD
jgi:hypothetical protein